MAKSEALNQLKAMIKAAYQKTHPNFPEHAIPINTFDGLKPEKREKKRIEKFLNLTPGCSCNIIENRGQRIDNTTTIESYDGARRTVGSVEWRGSGMRKGIADMIAIIKGRAVHIELKRIYKNGRDRQSEYQKQQEAEVRASGGHYWIVHSFEDFYHKFTAFTNEINNSSF
jgi:hypothetical protein